MRATRFAAKAVGVATALVATVTMVVAPTTSAAVASPARLGESTPPIDVLNAGLSQAVADGEHGAIGMVYDAGTEQYTAVGTSDLYRGVPADPQSQFRIGSNTKAFVSTVILQLEAEGKLSLDDTVAHWLPGLVNANGNDGTKITIRELLNMTSNIPDFLSTSYLSTLLVGALYVADLTPYQQWAPQDLVRAATANKPTSANPPGTTYAYSNTNYILAGMIIQTVTGHSAAVEIDNRIIKPLGLTHTYFPVSDPVMHGNYLHGYFLLRDVSTSNVSVTGAAGAMVSTLSDLGAFNRALFSGRLLPAAQMAELETTVPTGQPGVGFGLGVLHAGTAATGCAPGWLYDGAPLGYYSTVMTSPDGTQQVVAVSNEETLLPLSAKGTADQTRAAVATYCAMQ